jgi:hypothetical protein
MRLPEFIKYVVYRTPIFDRLMRPTYPYKIDPGELCALIKLVNVTRDSGGGDC